MSCVRVWKRDIPSFSEEFNIGWQRQGFWTGERRGGMPAWIAADKR